MPSVGPWPECALPLLHDGLDGLVQLAIDSFFAPNTATRKDLRAHVRLGDTRPVVIHLVGSSDSVFDEKLSIYYARCSETRRSPQAKIRLHVCFAVPPHQN